MPRVHEEAPARPAAPAVRPWPLLPGLTAQDVLDIGLSDCAADEGK